MSDLRTCPARMYEHACELRYDHDGNHRHGAFTWERLEPPSKAEKVVIAHGGCMAAATDPEHLCSIDCVPEPRSRNGRPYRTHERSCTTDDHYDHTVRYDATCAECGCCWGCDDDCCAEAFCLNAGCGCSKAMRVPVNRPGEESSQ